MQKLHNEDVYGGFTSLLDVDLQGWNSLDPSFEALISETRPRVLVDVGVWKGGSTIHMAQLIKKHGIDGVVIGVDTFLGGPEHMSMEPGGFGGDLRRQHGYPGLYWQFLSNVIRCDVCSQVVPLPQTSEHAALVLAELGIKADFVHLDAAHKFDAVMQDARRYWELLSDGGVLMGDDFCDPWPEVVRAAHAFAKEVGRPLEISGLKWIVRKQDAARIVDAPAVASQMMAADASAVAGARFYVVSHHDQRLDVPEGCVPIYVGKSAMKVQPEVMTDLLTNGTMLRNSRWSELSAIYKVWQDGPRSEIVGFGHYRRYFNFNSADHAGPQDTVTRDEFKALMAHAFDAATIDLVRDRAAIVSYAHEFGQSVADQYREAHIYSDYLDMFSLATERYPEIGRQMVRQFQNTTMYANNLFVLAWADFDELCRLWFDVLGTLGARIQWPRGRDAYQDRDLSFLSERLFDAWVRHRRDEGLRIIEKPVFFTT